jgi:hypothetical protein
VRQCGPLDPLFMQGPAGGGDESGPFVGAARGLRRRVSLG